MHCDLQELEKLAQQFEENILDATKSFEKVITDKNELEGLPLSTLSITAKTAIDKVSEDFQVLADSALNLIVFHICASLYVRDMRMPQLKMVLG